MPKTDFQRPLASILRQRLSERPEFIQILAGPRQVGKTTLVNQLRNERPPESTLLITADQIDDRDLPYPQRSEILGRQSPEEWLVAQWEDAKKRAAKWQDGRSEDSNLSFLLVIDEIQTIKNWSAIIKGLWDARRASSVSMQVVLLGSAPLLIQKGLTESLAGRYELIRATHWSFEEMNSAFDTSLEQFIYFGGYPGSAKLMSAEPRWRAYVRDALVEPNIQRDIFDMERVDKPALLRQLFETGCNYSGQIMSLDKITRHLGGHTLTLASHLTLLSQAGLLTGLQKFARQTIRQRASPPKFQAHNNALMTVAQTYGFLEAKADRSYWGRICESAFGAHLLSFCDADTKLLYWREGDLEVDFVLEHRGQLAAFEVKTSELTSHHRGLQGFVDRYSDARTFLIGSADYPLGEALRQNLADWFA